jgi:O-methyltransferase
MDHEVTEQPRTTASAGDGRAAELYLDLLKKTLTRSAFAGRYQTIQPLHGSWKRLLYAAHLPIRHALGAAGIELVRRTGFDPEHRAEGRDIPPDAETMIGLRRLDNIQACLTDVIEQGVPGDLIETGVWRGGATIFMRGVLAAYGDEERTVWVADSFRGLPHPDSTRYADDPGDSFWRNPHLAVPVEEVRENFRRYGLLDDQVRFLEGWFEDTLPDAPIERLALVRLDGDMYGSTMVALESLYPKLSVGGYVLVDDYGGGAPECTRAVDEFREREGISEPIVAVDWNGAYWQKLR